VTTATASIAVPSGPRRFDGPVHRPGDARYDELRRPLNPELDPRPSFVVEAANARDVRSAVLMARDAGLPVAVQATGHGARRAYRGGLLVNTSAMSTVLVAQARLRRRQRRARRAGDGLGRRHLREPRRAS
jgi:hypothetical protein